MTMDANELMVKGKTYTSLTGWKNYAIIRAVTSCTDVLMMSSSSEKRMKLNMNVSDPYLTFNPAYGFNDEVVLIALTNMRKVNVVDVCISTLDTLIEGLSKMFSQDEELYMAAEMQLFNSADKWMESLPNSAVIKTLKEDSLHRRDEFFRSRWFYPWLDMIPLTIKDFKNARDALLSPDRFTVTMDPFIIEKRKTLFRAVVDLASRLRVTSYTLQEWLAFEKPSVEDFFSVAIRVELPIVNEKEFKELNELVLKIREEHEWIDPFIMLRDEYMLKLLL